MWPPISFDPVNDKACTSGCCTSSSPISLPGPRTRFNTPAGNPASLKISTTFTAVSDVISAGFSTTVLPATIAGAAAFSRHKFQNINRTLHFDERFLERLSFFQGQNAGDVVLLLGHQRGCFGNDAAANRRRRVAPCRKCGFCRSDGLARLFPSRKGDYCNDLIDVRGVSALPGAARA